MDSAQWVCSGGGGGGGGGELHHSENTLRLFP